MSTRIFKLILFASICSVFVVGCSEPTSVQIIQQSAERAEDLCDNIKHESRTLCIEVVRKRAKFFTEYETISQKAAAGIVNSVVDAIESTPMLLNDKALMTRWLCEVSITGRVMCQSLATVLASADLPYTQALISDIALLEARLVIGKIDTLVKCGNGVILLDEFGMLLDDFFAEQDTIVLTGAGRGPLRELDDDLINSVLVACGPSVGRETGQGGEASGGYSGVTGLDNILGDCAIGATSVRSNDIMTAMISYMSSLSEACTGTGSIAPTEGNILWEDLVNVALPIRPYGSLTGRHGDIDFDNKGVGSIDYPNGEERPIGEEDGLANTAWFREDADGGSQWIGAVWDDVGNLIWIEAGYKDADGNEQRYSYEFDPASGTETQTYENSSGDKWTSTYNANGSESHEYENTTTGDGYSASQDASGNGSYSDSDGNDITTDSDGNVTSWTRNDVVIVSSESCSDPDLCSGCQSAAGIYAQMAMECAGSLGGSQLCQALLGANACCQNSTVSLGDPRVAMPMSDGNFTCMGGQSPTREDECERNCGIASGTAGVASTDIDCVSECRETRGTVAGASASFLLRTCLYAISDACAGSSAISFPFVGTSPFEGDLPLPSITANGLLFPPI